MGEVVALPRPPLDEASLVAGLAAASPHAIGELFDRYHGLIRSMLCRSLGSSHDVEDLMQETFLLVLRRVSTLREPHALRSFVVGIAIRVARNELRKRKLRRWVGLEPDGGELEPGEAHDPVAAESVRRIYAVLDRLDATDRMIFVLRRVEGYELQEIAEAMGLSLSTIKRYLARAEARFDMLSKRDPLLRDYLHARGDDR